MTPDPARPVEPPESRRVITHIGACELTVCPPFEDDPRGFWVEATCAEHTAAQVAAGGLDRLHVWSSLTDLDGVYGSPFIFTMWGGEEWPVAAAGGAPDDRKPCAMQHAVFVRGEAMPDARPLEPPEGERLPAVMVQTEDGYEVFCRLCDWHVLGVETLESTGHLAELHVGDEHFDA